MFDISIELSTKTIKRLYFYSVAVLQLKGLNLKYFLFGYLPKIKYIYKNLGDYPINIIK